MKDTKTKERKKYGRFRMMVDFTKGSRTAFIVCIAATAFAAFTDMLMQYTLRVTNSMASERLVKTMRDSVFSHIERLPYRWHQKIKTGDIIQRSTSDVDTIKRFFSEQLVSILRIVVLITMSIIFMLTMNPKLTLVAVIPLPIVLTYSILFRKKISKTFRECDENEGRLSAMAQENLTGARVVRAFGRERYERDRFFRHNDYYTSIWVRLSRTMAFFWSSSDILSGMQIMLVVVFGSVFCVKGPLTPGELVAFIAYNAKLVWPIRMLGRMISEMSKAGVSIERVHEIMAAEEEHDHDGAAPADMTGDIVFENVSFSYTEGKEILKNIDLTIKSGTTLGILGGTGSGKSTLMLLLDKMYEVKEGCGRITIGGVDVRDISTEHLRRNIGIVLQEPFLFSRTLGENIGIKTDSITDEEIKAASRAAHLAETAESFANGYDTFVGERGVTLSGGQKQRAAIARNFTTKCPIMIFDDSLSAVDTETDAKIRREIESRFGTATVIIISHRITTLSKADKIIVLDDGAIVEEGTHDELKCAGGIYARINEIQSGFREEAAS